MAEKDRVPDGTTGRRVSIVFQETGGGRYQIFLDGMTSADMRKPPEDMTPAEWNAVNAFRKIVAEREAVGVVTGRTKRNPS